MSTPFDQDLPAPPKRSLFARMRANFLTGLVVIAPVGLTIWLIWTVVGWIDGWVLPLVPNSYQPDKFIQNLLGLDPEVQINIRGIGVVIFLVFTMVVGWMAKGLIGRSLIRFGESLVERTPVVRSVYSGIKQISETVFAQSERSFEKACIIDQGYKLVLVPQTGALSLFRLADDPFERTSGVASFDCARRAHGCRSSAHLARGRWRRAGLERRGERIQEANGRIDQHRRSCRGLGFCAGVARRRQSPVTGQYQFFHAHSVG